MTDIHFYHLTRAALEQALPDLLEKTLARNWRAVVMTGSPERAEALTQHLWTNKPNGFLPHGNARDGHAEQQPIWLTAEDERPNTADILFLTDGATSARMGDYARVCMMFDGNDAEVVATARARWTDYKNSGHTLTYWQQTDRGWEKRG